jgi:hypothetical protein
LRERGRRGLPSSPVFCDPFTGFLYGRTGMTETWELVSMMVELVVIPMLGWVLFTMVSQGKQIIRLEEKVNDALNRRMTSIETKVISMESKLESKIDSLEESVVDCKLTINDKLNEKFDTLIDRMEQR